MTDQYFIIQKRKNLVIYDSENGKKVKTLEFIQKVCDFVSNGDEELIVAFPDGLVEIWKGA